MRRLSLAHRCAQANSVLAAIVPSELHGCTSAASGLIAEVTGLAPFLAIGDRLSLRARTGPIPAEVVALRDGRAQVMALGALDGVGPGTTAAATTTRARPDAGRPGTLQPCAGWLGRVLDPVGRPLDQRGPLPCGPINRPVRAAPPEATGRARLGPRLDLGVRALDLFATCRQGQRLGLFAGSGVGKSTLLSMLAKRARCDVIVLALVGERGREVREFLEDDLGPDGLARSVVIVATSDAPPLLRREAAYAAMTVAEHFCAEGKSVLLLMDSVTRFCHALREVALTAGEPPATRGYPPGVFAELPRLLERAGPGPVGAGGQITALFTVLVEGDDHNEPVADAVRGILDGHVILDRRIGERGRYPAVDVLRSLSRTVPGCLASDEAALARRARAVLALDAEMADLVRLGAYRSGTDPQVDEALRLAPRIEAVLRQERDEPDAPQPLRSPFEALREALEDGHARA